MTKRTVPWLVFALFLAAILVASGYVLDLQLVSFTAAQRQSAFLPLLEKYRQTEASASGPGYSLDAINNGFMKNSDLSLHGAPPRLLLNLGPDGTQRALQVEREQARKIMGGLARSQHDLISRGYSYDHGTQTLFLSRESPFIKLGVFRTIVGLGGHEVATQRRYLVASLGSLWTFAVGVMAFVLWGPSRAIPISPTIRGPSTPEGFSVFAGARPMEGQDPFAPHHQKPAGERFFKSEYLVAKDEPSLTNVETKPLPTRLRTYGEVMAPKESKSIESGSRAE